MRWHRPRKGRNAETPEATHLLKQQKNKSLQFLLDIDESVGPTAEIGGHGGRQSVREEENAWLE
jgi:hypothetical protein